MDTVLAVGSQWMGRGGDGALVEAGVGPDVQKTGQIAVVVVV